jgi:hypothetical protein
MTNSELKSKVFALDNKAGPPVRGSPRRFRGSLRCKGRNRTPPGALPPEFLLLTGKSAKKYSSGVTNGGVKCSVRGPVTGGPSGTRKSDGVLL